MRIQTYRLQINTIQKVIEYLILYRKFKKT